MKSPTFITGNQDKADYLARYLDLPIDHHKIDLDEIQSLEPADVINHKLHQAYNVLKAPVIVEDTSLEFTALGKLPGTFIKFFLQEMSSQQICDLLNDKDRSATARCAFGYYDGQNLKIIEGTQTGTIAHNPAGNSGFGWDTIFIPQGLDVTRSSLEKDDYERSYLSLKPFEKLKVFLKEMGY